VKKIKDVIVYRDPEYYAAFPSIVCRPDGELLVAFRRAPERRTMGGRCTHKDPNSQLVLVRSTDDGETWSESPELIYAHPLGGSQDPCMVQLADGTILCASYLWILMPETSEISARRNGWKFGFAGGYLMRSSDGGHHWHGPITPPPVPGGAGKDYLGRPLPACARGAMLEGSDGLLYWVVTRADVHTPEERRWSIHLLVSPDQGETWEYRCPVAEDAKVTFNETSLYETPAGDLVAFVRTADFDDHTVIVRSKDRGRSFEPWEDAGFQGHPHCACRLPDGRAFLVYGYRHEPYGIRARVLDPECTDIAAPEIVLRDDGGSGDLGYPWVTLLPDGRVLAVYYLNIAKGPRHIAGTLLSPGS